MSASPNENEARNAAVNEVVRALNYDIEEKKIRVESKVEPFWIEADEQLLRQALFNLLLNSIQAVGENAFGSDDGDAAAAREANPRFGIDNVRIALAVDDRVLIQIARRRHRHVA